MFTQEDGELLVKLARNSVEVRFGKEKLKIDDDKLNEKRGVFVSIYNYPDKSLRGCIGFPKAEFPVKEGVQKAAILSAFEDTRFSPLEREELDKIIFEVSVLTEPELITIKKPEEYLKKIVVGRDGLILQNGPFYGLLLPHVPVEYGWSVEEFLENLAWKAGLSPDWVYDKNTKIWKFQSQIFAEKEPRGEVVEIKLTK
jgi:uncharacterized protein (TIGR00296 family)